MSGRPSARILSVAALTAAILGVTGCYGQTDLATHIGPTSATLNARGAANSGPVEPYFEYWKTATPQATIQTPIRIIGPGAKGPFAEPVRSLTNHTQYSFRLCGSDSSTGGRAVCAQTRSFITGLASVQV